MPSFVSKTFTGFLGAKKFCALAFPPTGTLLFNPFSSVTVQFPEASTGISVISFNTLPFSALST